MRGRWYTPTSSIHYDPSDSNADVESSSVIKHPLNLHCGHSISTSKKCSDINDVLSPNNKCWCRSVAKLLVPYFTLLSNDASKEVVILASLIQNSTLRRMVADQWLVNVAVPIMGRAITKIPKLATRTKQLRQVYWSDSSKRKISI